MMESNVMMETLLQKMVVLTLVNSKLVTTVQFQVNLVLVLLIIDKLKTLLFVLINVTLSKILFLVTMIFVLSAVMVY